MVQESTHILGNHPRIPDTLHIPFSPTTRFHIQDRYSNPRLDLGEFTERYALGDVVEPENTAVSATGGISLLLALRTSMVVTRLRSESLGEEYESWQRVVMTIKMGSAGDLN